jgi:DNA-directed RNA polymerase subunit M/transcription elongation factor TFIIS
MNCPKCGNVMNHHADKVMYAEHEDSMSETLTEFYTCPKCGTNASQTAE